MWLDSVSTLLIMAWGHYLWGKMLFLSKLFCYLKQ